MNTPPSPALEPLEAFPIPQDAVVLQHWSESGSARELAVAAMQQAMGERRLTLALGPQLELGEPLRLLSLNRFAVQLVCGGVLADELSIPLAPWRAEGASPQLLLAALVDEENGVVAFPGVLTSTELQALAPQCSAWSSGLEAVTLDADAFQGGIDRLLALVQVLEPGAIPRLRPAARAELAPLITRIGDWLEGRLTPALAELGAELLPAGSFRTGDVTFRTGGVTAASTPPQALTILSIPLGLTSGGALLWGGPAKGCIERFRLLLIPTGDRAAGQQSGIEQLTLRLVGELEGDLLPDGLLLSATLGSRRYSVSSAASTVLALDLPAADDLIEVTLIPPGGTPLVLPPLQLPGG